MATDFLYIRTESALQQFCQDLAKESLISFDTEFVAEDSYRPLLCLIQVATENQIAIIDPLECEQLAPFWELLVDPDRTVVVHAGREEILFCYRATGKLIPNLFDIQIGAGFLGYEYPASYGKLVQRVVGRTLDKEETRSDWRQRPLSRQQLEYAAQDVRDLVRIYKSLSERLHKHGRLTWLMEETQLKQEELSNIESSENWHRLSGVSALSGKSLSIARGLWNWRDAKARQRNIPPRKILRDDLIIELARRGSADPRRVASLRGMEYRNTRQLIPELTDIIEEAIQHPPPNWPRKHRYGKGQPASMLTQFLSAAMAFICHHQHIAPMLVATSDDLRDFVLYRLDRDADQTHPPALLRGWRADIVGRDLDDLLEGKIGIVLENPHSDIPIKFIRPHG
ncbi:MAG: HRDC domain-containing protein [Pirellula sp.]|nr:HRDC domain-containing protein [Pirellula sp.]